MPQNLPRSLPDRPHLDHLKKQAKELLHAFQEGDAEAAARFRALASTSHEDGPKLADALHVVANEYGFASWPRLKAHVESATKPFDPLDALRAAVRANDLGAVRRLFIEHPALKAKINDPLPDAGFGETMLIRAVQRNNRDLIEILLGAGADINQKSHWWAGGFSVLDNANDKPELARFLMDRGARLDAPTAAGLGMFDALKALVIADPSAVHARGGDGQMALHRARTIEMAELLLDHGAEIDARDIDHESTPAQYAVRERQDVARALVSRGCWTDILMAAALGDRALVQRHLDADPACIRTSVSDEYFPKQDPRAGGTIYIWTLGWHKTPHALARERTHDDIFELLMDRSPDELKFAIACDLGDERLSAQIVQQHPDIVQRLSAEDLRHLPHAAHEDNAHVVHLMLAAGWPPDARYPDGTTALHWAAFHGNLEMARDLLRHHAPVDVKESTFGATPLGWAVYGSEHGWHPERGKYPEVVEALLEAGAQAPTVTEDLDASEPVRAILRRHSSP